MIRIKPDLLEGLVPRILELTSRMTPWHRRVWRAGTLELVEEALSESMIPGTRTQALEELREYMRVALGNDPGVSSAQKKLKTVIENAEPYSEFTSHDVELARHYIRDIRKSYLLNWADLLEDPSKAGKVDVEGTAKRIVSHLLYCGVPAATVYQVIHDHASSIDEVTFADVLRELDEKSKGKPRDFTFAIPVDRGPSFLIDSSVPSGWMTPKQLKQWKHRYATRATNVRHYGGFILTVQARDVNEAASEVQRQLPQLAFKFQAGSESPFSITHLMWSQEKGSDFPTRKTAHTLKIRAFQRANTLHDLEINRQTRNILAILEPLNTNDSHVAVVNGWVAIESLLVDSLDKDRVAAERMAKVVAASYFRTEMTWLAKNYVKAYRGVAAKADEMYGLEQSIDRARLMADLILQGADFELLDQDDHLAIKKMRKALTSPSEAFDRTKTILKREFQRLYRKRNLIVHTGRAVEHGIESVAETVLPLLFNGIDQLLIANIQFGLDPKALAASVEFKAAHLKPQGNSDLYEILDLLEVQTDTGNISKINP